MKFTLLIATLDRYDLLKTCVQSLLKETYTEFEIIIVDQTSIQEIDKLDLPKDDRIKYTHIEIKGSSHARNVGINLATGDYICLIDDDGEYEATYLEKAKKIIEEKKPTVLGGQIIDPITNEEKWSRIERNIKFKDVFNCFCSAGMIIEAEFQKQHLYDELFGVGSKYGSGEETDIVLAALHAKRKVIYSPSIRTKHPADMLASVSEKKISSYAFGFGALCRKIYENYSKKWGLYHLVKTVAGNYLVGVLQIAIRIDPVTGKKRLLRAKSTMTGYKDYKKAVR